ncbi:hypothetical protein HBI51_251170 [Parastagonospora nodorum]|nr:hypothetical protein HBI51_251170 [Parastagonospora nodorum]KAH6380456.1 hypothetical protein HBI08_238850 [Parastagonospora nodorum]
MQTPPSSLRQKRPLSPQTQFDPVSQGKRRATSDDKPMLHLDTRVPSRPTPEFVFLPTTSPSHARPAAAHTDTVDFSTSLDWVPQNMWLPPATDWTQHAGLMHTTTSTDRLQYNSEVGFVESCKSSVWSSASYSVFSSLSGLSSFDDPFGDLSGMPPSDPQSSLPSQADTSTRSSIDTVIARLRALQNVLAGQSSMLEEVVRVLRVQQRP